MQISVHLRLHQHLKVYDGSDVKHAMYCSIGKLLV